MVSTGASTSLRISAVMLYICSQLAGGSTLTLPLGPVMRFAGCLFPFLSFGLLPLTSPSSSSSSSSNLGALREVRRRAGSVVVSVLTAAVVLLLRFRFPSDADSL